MTLLYIPSKNHDKIVAGNRLPYYSIILRSVRKNVVCGMWDGSGQDISKPKTPKRKKPGIKASGYQFQSSSSSSLLFWTEVDGDVESGFITTPNPPAWPCRSPSSSSNEVCAADLPGIEISVCVGNMEVTSGFVDIEAPVTGDGVGVDHAFKKD